MRIIVNGSRSHRREGEQGRNHPPAALMGSPDYTLYSPEDRIAFSCKGPPERETGKIILPFLSFYPVRFLHG